MTDQISVRLSPEQAQKLVDAGNQITQLRALITQAERAGLPVAELRTRVEEAERLRNGLLTEFGPASRR